MPSVPPEGDKPGVFDCGDYCDITVVPPEGKVLVVLSARYGPPAQLSEFDFTTEVSKLVGPAGLALAGGAHLHLGDPAEGVGKTFHLEYRFDEETSPEPEPMDSVCTRLVELHLSYICDGCNAGPMIGKRYRSLEKDNYDFCEACFSKVEEEKAAIWAQQEPTAYTQCAASQEQHVESAIYVSLADPWKFEDVTDVVNLLIEENGINDFTARQDLNDVFGDPAFGDEKVAVLVKDGRRLEFFESGKGGPCDMIYDASALSESQEVDNAIYMSLVDPALAKDVTVLANRLFAQNGSNDFTKGKDLNEVFGDPAFGDEKKLVLTRGPRKLELLESGKGGPHDKVYDVSRIWCDHKVDRAVYMSVMDPTEGKDVTDSVNDLLAAFPLEDFTGRKDLNDVFGDPVFGYEKKLVLTMGDRTLELFESYKGGPMDKVYNVAEFFQDSPREPPVAAPDSDAMRVLREADSEVVKVALLSLLTHPDSSVRKAAAATTVWAAAATAITAAAAAEPAHAGGAAGEGEEDAEENEGPQAAPQPSRAETDKVWDVIRNMEKELTKQGMLAARPTGPRVQQRRHVEEEQQEFAAPDGGSGGGAGGVQPATPAPAPVPSALVVASEGLQADGQAFAEDPSACGDASEELSELLAATGARQVYRLGRIVVPASGEDEAAQPTPLSASFIAINDGAAQWPETTALVHLGGDALGFPGLQLGSAAPGEAVRVVLDLAVPPCEAGTASRSAWALVDASTGLFLGPAAVLEVLWVGSQ